MQKKGMSAALGSYKDALSIVGYSNDSDNVAALKNSLRYLQRLQLATKHGRDKRRLRPPFELVSYEGGVLTVTMDKGFYQFVTGFLSRKPRARVPLPLPKDPATQNLLFLVAATRWKPVLVPDDDDENGEVLEKVADDRVTVAMDVIAKKVGLDHSMKYRDLRRAMDAVVGIYAGLRGAVIFQEVSGAQLAVALDLTRAGPAYKRTKFVRFILFRRLRWSPRIGQVVKLGST